MSALTKNKQANKKKQKKTLILQRTHPHRTPWWDAVQYLFLWWEFTLKCNQLEGFLNWPIQLLIIIKFCLTIVIAQGGYCRPCRKLTVWLQILKQNKKLPQKIVKPNNWHQTPSVLMSKQCLWVYLALELHYACSGWGEWVQLAAYKCETKK